MLHHISKVRKKKIGGRNEDKFFYSGTISMGIAAALGLLDLTMIKIAFGDTSLSTMTIYPAAFFTFLGLFLMYHGLKPFWKK